MRILPSSVFSLSSFTLSFIFSLSLSGGREWPSPNKIVANLKMMIPVIPSLLSSLGKYVKLATVNFWSPIKICV